MAIINKTGITNGGTIQAEHVTRTIDALSGGSADTVVATGSFTGSFKGVINYYSPTLPGDVVQFDLEQGIINDADGLPTIDYWNRGLVDPQNDVSLNWSDRQLLALQSSASIDWQSRVLYDTDERESVNWTSRELYNSSGQTVVNWESKTFNGTASFATSASRAVSSSFSTTSSLARNLTLIPIHPLPSGAATGSFAVSASTPPKPYFWDGSNWNALY